MKRKIIAISMASMLACGLATGCGGIEYEPEEDATKSYLYVDSFSGGFGSEFFNVVARAFEKEYENKSYVEGKTGVRIEVGESTTNNSAQFKNGVANASSDVHVVEGLYYTDYLKDQTILDLTEIVTATLSDGDTIENKLNTEQKRVLNYGGKYYTIPTFAGFSGLTYNADLFADKNLYFADSTESPEDTVSSYTGKAYTGRPLVRNANVKKSPGPDGKYNTADDGLPSSYEEFFYLYDTMLDKSPSITPMILYGGHYSNYIFQELLCAATTANGMNAMFSFDSNGEAVEVIDSINNDGTYTTKKVVITESNGYEATQQVSKYMATKFIKHLSTNTVGGKSYIDDRSRGESLSNINAQKLFMESSLDPSLTPIATLVEGVYWYNEAAGTREGIMQTYPEAENMNLKYMPLPAKEYGTVTENNGTTQLVADAFLYYLVVNAKVANNPEKLDLAKDFIKFMYSNEMLQEMTLATGIPFALKYDLTEEQFNSMDTLSQSFWSVYKGAKDNDAYITGLSLSPIFMSDTKFSFKTTTNAFKSMVNGAETEDALAYFYGNKNCSAKDFFEGMYIDEDGWKKYIN